MPESLPAFWVASGRAGAPLAPDPPQEGHVRDLAFGPPDEPRHGCGWRDPRGGCLTAGAVGRPTPPAAAESVRDAHDGTQSAPRPEVHHVTEPLRGGQRELPGRRGYVAASRVPALLHCRKPDAVHRRRHGDRLRRLLAS